MVRKNNELQFLGMVVCVGESVTHAAEWSSKIYGNVTIFFCTLCFFLYIFPKGWIKLDLAMSQNPICRLTAHRLTVHIIFYFIYYFFSFFFLSCRFIVSFVMGGVAMDLGSTGSL